MLEFHVDRSIPLIIIDIVKSIIGNVVNENSFVFILEFGSNKFMFTGDAGSTLDKVSTLEKQAKKLGLSNIKVDVIKWPHHGSEGLSDDFIKATNPKYFVVPNYNNGNSPPTSTRTALSKKGIKIYRQSDSTTGNILITSDGTNVKIKMNIKASSYAK